jgi:hypothetical protein
MAKISCSASSGWMSTAAQPQAFYRNFNPTTQTSHVFGPPNHSH